MLHSWPSRLRIHGRHVLAQTLLLGLTVLSVLRSALVRGRALRLLVRCLLLAPSAPQPILLHTLGFWNLPTSPMVSKGKKILAASVDSPLPPWT
ncbi:hypothetical protein BD310DRAFT_917475 [Dichomitus squalens]|uniref:Uncharacterized protein n=1 Tax=Dichomitus squalens TaxID=114155 RepID=A0A4Q9Q6I5_9APHY|nr:hypothetical protein BD310DRAFT_917475 [Dichomitus squalens]